MKGCQHLHLDRQAPNSPAQQLHSGPEAAFRCPDCGAIFFVLLVPAQITVTHEESRGEPK